MSRELRASVLAELRAIVKERGTLQPAEIVQRARDEESPLHPYFEWDDGEAAEAYRLMQARGLARSFRAFVTVTGRSEPESTRAFVSLTTDRRDGLGYRPLEMILREPAQYEQLLMDALAELRAFKRKYAVLSELQTVIDAIDRVIVRAPRIDRRPDDGDRPAPM